MTSAVFCRTLIPAQVRCQRPLLTPHRRVMDKRMGMHASMAVHKETKLSMQATMVTRKEMELGMRSSMTIRKRILLKIMDMELVTHASMLKRLFSIRQLPGRRRQRHLGRVLSHHLPSHHLLSHHPRRRLLPSHHPPRRLLPS